METEKVTPLIVCCPKCTLLLVIKLGDFSGRTEKEMLLQLHCPNCDFPLTLKIYEFKGQTRFGIESTRVMGGPGAFFCASLAPGPGLMGLVVGSIERDKWLKQTA